MYRTFDKSVLGGVGMIVALLLLNAGLAYRNTRQLLEDAGWVAHTYQVLDLTSDVLRTLVDAETGQGGFLITGRENFLEPYQQALDRLDQQVRTLKETTQDNPRQQARIGELETLTTERLALLKKSIDLRRQSAEEAQALVATGQGKAKMETIRRLIATMKEEEYSLLQVRERRSAVAYRNAVATELISTALGLALVGALVYLVRRRLQERSRAAALAHEQQERLQTTLTSIGDAVIVTDAEGRVTLMNPVAQNLTRWKDGAAGCPLGEGFRIVNEQTRQPLESPVTEVIRQGVVVGLANHTSLIAKDGGEVPIDVSGAPIRNAKGEIVGVVLVFRDVTERRRLERFQRDVQAELERQVQERTAELRASEERFRLLVEGMQDYAIFLLDPQGRVVNWNPAAERIKNYSAEEIVGQHFSRFYTEEAIDQGRPEIELEVARTEGRFEAEGWRVRKDGSRFWANVIITALHDEAGNLRGFSKITRDLTETKQTEESAHRLLEERAGRRAAEEAERQVRASEERLRQFVEHTPAAVAMLDRDMNYLLVSQRRLSDFGLEGQDIIGRNYYEVFPNVSERWKEIHRRCLAGTEARSEEDHMIRPDGQEVWLRWEICPWRDQQGEIGGMMVFSEVITERKRAQEALRQQREWLRVTLTSIGDAVITTDTEGRVTFLNPVAESLTGWCQENAQGQPLEAVFPILNEQTRQPIENPVSKVIREGVTVGLGNHTVLLARDGVERPIDDSAAPIRGDKGETVGVVLIFRDVTEQRRQVEALRASEQRWRTMAEALPNLVWTALANGQCDWVSSQWRKYTGMPEEEMLGPNWLKHVIHPDDQEHTLACWQAACADQAHYDLEYRIRRYDGEYHWFKTRGVPIRDEQGNIIYWFGTCTDIEDGKRLEKALRETDRRKDEFLATLAHELRNPLAPIRTGLQVLRLAKDHQAQEEARAMMERQLGQMVRLIDDLLDISRISRNRLELRKARFPLASVIENAVETARPLIDSKGHKLTVMLPPQPIYLDADLTRLSQVFCNLLNNAAKFTDPGGRIELSAQLNGDEVVVAVRDTGIGILAPALPGLFNLFSQVDHSLERSQGGLGIGLALVKGLVEMHGGTVKACSEGIGRGSEFVVRLPLAQSTPRAEDASNNQVSNDQNKRRILVVDDNRDAAASLAMMLTLQGHDTRTAHDGLEALDVAAAFRPEVVLLDIGMPKLNGYDAARRIREEPWGRAIVLVACTGWGQQEDRRRSQEAGFNTHLVKPVDPAALAKLLSEFEAKIA